MDDFNKYYRCLFSLSGYHDFSLIPQKRNKPLSCCWCTKLEIDLRRDKSKYETR